MGRIYVDPDYYALCHHVVSEEDFERMSRLASARLDVLTHLRASRFEEAYDPEHATDFQKQVHTQIRDTVCELMDTLMLQETSGMGTGIASVSNGGYSESYKVTTRAEKELELLSVVREGLSGTGLAGAL